MRKRPTLRTWVTTSALAVTFTGAQAACGSETPLSLSPELSSLSIEKTPRLSAAVEAPASLAEADAQDQMILSKTLHIYAPLQPAQWVAMVNAAERRLLRQIQWSFSLTGSSSSVVEAAAREVELRRGELDLARVRRVIETQRIVHHSEADLTRALTSIRWEKPMRKFEGPGKFLAADLMPLSAEFESEFHHPMPVTARGETATHVRLGLDHRGKFDVGVSPETPEGIWLRRTLEARQIPYIAFCRAVRGSATAAHIHIGTASTRIPKSQRAAFRLAFYRERKRAHLRLSASVHKFHAYHAAAKAQTILLAKSANHATHRRRTEPVKPTNKTVAAVQKPVPASNVVLSFLSVSR
jgi:hypothetical protein